jgi:hypothetical protein
MAAPRRPLLAHLLVRDGLVSRDQLAEALRAQAEPPYPPFDRVLVDRKLITPAQLNAALERYHRKHRLGAVLVEMRLLTDDQLRRALQHQARTGRRLGDVLLELNLVSERQLKEALGRQFGFRFEDLDRLTLDPSLAGLVDPAFARARRVLPIARSANRLTLAMEDPTDADAVDTLAAATGCEIDVVTATAAAVRRALARLCEAAPASAGAPRPPARAAGAAGPPASAAAAPASPRSVEPAAPAPALVALEASHAATAAALADLEARHGETVRALAELQAAHGALRDEREAARRALAEAEARQAATARTLAELQAAHEAARAAPPPADVEARHAQLTEALARSHAERDANLAALRELHQRHADALLALRSAQEALADLRAAQGGISTPLA